MSKMTYRQLADYTKQRQIMRWRKMTKEAGEDRPTRGLPRFSTQPEAREAIVINVYDAERVEQWVAWIERPKRGRPQLKLPFTMGALGSSTGLMIEPIQEALR